MNPGNKKTGEVIDTFVLYINQSGPEPKVPNEVPAELRKSDADYGMVRWEIRAASPNPALNELLHKLPQPWPAAFRSLVDRYHFCNFEIGPLMFFANTGRDLFYELSQRVLKDAGIFPILHQHGFLQFGLPHEASYDPVCFDMKSRTREDAPIVQLDHEEILIRRRIRVVKTIAPSLCAFMRSAIDQRLPVA